jgi:hypothetical protein
MYNEKAGKYIKDVNDSYLKILNEDVENEVKEKKRLTGIEKDKIEEAYEKMMTEAVLKGNQLWMTEIQMYKNTSKVRNTLEKWAKSKGAAFIKDYLPKKVVIDDKYVSEIIKAFPDDIDGRGNRNIYIKNPKTGALKKSKIA